MIEEEGVLVLREAILPIVGFLREAGYFESLAAAKALANSSPTGRAYVTIGFWKPLKRELARKNAQFWPLVVEELPHERAKRYFVAHGMNRLVGQMTDTDIKFLKRFMANNWVKEDEAARRLKDSAICSPSRIKRIVRTERTRARNGSALETAIEKGYTHKTWWCAGDERSRSLHRKRHGVTVPIDEPFPFGGRPMFPGDGPAYEAVNCRCRMLLSRE